MARPSKYTPEVVKRIEEALETGATYKLAAAYAGIHFDTFNAWRQEFSDFSDLNQSQGEIHMVVRTASAGSTVALV